VTEHRLADRAARVLRAVRASVGPRPAGDPAPAIAALAEAIRASTRRRRRVRAVVGAAGALTAAAGLAVALWGARPAPVSRPAPAVEVAAAGRAPFTIRDLAAAPGGTGVAAFAVGAADGDSDGGRTPALYGGGRAARAVAAGDGFAPGDTLVSGHAALELAAGDGTEVRLAAASEVTLERADAVRWFRLRSGSLYAHVAKLRAGERFVVVTPDRQIEVRGTRFRVSLVHDDPACGGGSVTRVAVEEGVVTVTVPGGAELRVAAGERWPGGCAQPPTPAAVAPAGAVARAGGAAARTPAPRRVEAPSASTLAAENDLFGRAARAARAGDSAAALRLLEQLVARYPDSPLREAAEAERLRIVRTAPSQP
jgi:ferric-dicitrate binding protein FerR (iron transport regulator)